MNSRQMAAQAKGLAAQAIRGSAAALTVLVVSSLPATAIPQCIAYNIVASGGSERGDINTFEELCGPAASKRQTCGCLTRGIGTGFSTPLSRQLFRIEVLVDAYPFYQDKFKELRVCMSQKEWTSYFAEKSKFMNSPSFQSCK